MGIRLEFVLPALAEVAVGCLSAPVVLVEGLGEGGFPMLVLLRFVESKLLDMLGGILFGEIASPPSPVTVVEVGTGVLVRDVAVVMNRDISKLLACHVWISFKYRRKSLLLASLSDSPATLEETPLISISLGLCCSLPSPEAERSLTFREADAASAVHVLTKHSVSFERCSSRNLPTSATSDRSVPSTAITAPRISSTGEVGPGGASGGEIFARTLILLR